MLLSTRLPPYRQPDTTHETPVSLEQLAEKPHAACASRGTTGARTCTAAEREALRTAGFGFYDWGPDAARFVAAWDTKEEHARALARAIAGL